MKAALISFILLPLVVIALTRIRFGFRVFHVLAASVVGEVLGLFLYAYYKQVKASAVLSGLASGTIAYTGGGGPRGMVEAVLKLAAFGIALGLLVLGGHWAYARARSTLQR
ncbi:MAG: hypothetical protein M3Z54_07965 [Gemmatimonadota bacterium]|nr:hypothetical protein [Gemmatimonadota bacterium]